MGAWSPRRRDSGAPGGPRADARPPQCGALLAASFVTRFFSPGNVKKLGEMCPKISNAQNAELRLRWGQIVLKNDHQEDFWKVKEFLHSQVGTPGSLTPSGTRRAGPRRPPSLGQRAWQVPRAGCGAALGGRPPGLGACAGQLERPEGRGWAALAGRWEGGKTGRVSAGLVWGEARG